MNEAKKYSDEKLCAADCSTNEKFDELMSNLEKDCVYKIE